MTKTDLKCQNTGSYRNVAKDSLPAFDGQGDVERTLFLCGLTVGMLLKSVLAKLDNAIGVTKLLNLQGEKKCWPECIR